MKTALVTGASSGIGKNFALIHAKNGGDLVITARRSDNLLELKQLIESKYKRNCYVIVKDLSKENAANEIFEEINKNNIEIEYLFNNAGFGGRGYFVDRKLEDELKMINVNISSLVALTRLFLPRFIERNSGRILNVSSAASLAPGPRHAVYFASKSFVKSFSYALSKELESTNITVTCTMPGSTDSEFGKNADMTKTRFFKKPISPQKTAEISYKAMMRGKRNAYPGFSKLLLFSLKFIPSPIVLEYVSYNHKER